jgi:hypothetical protein
LPGNQLLLAKSTICSSKKLAFRSIDLEIFLPAGFRDCLISISASDITTESYKKNKDKGKAEQRNYSGNRYKVPSRTDHV